MTSEFSDIKNLVTKTLAITTPFDLVITEGWNSQTKGFRSEIREGLLRNLLETKKAYRGSSQKLGFSIDEQTADRLLNIETLPKILGLSFSISHSTDYGGFCWVSSPLNIGFDIENSSRVREKTAQRISTPEEYVLAPSAADLWVAKEATWKCLFHLQQPKTLTELRIDSWHKMSHSLSVYKASRLDFNHSLQGLGCTIAHKNVHLGFFISTFVSQ